MSPQYFLSSSRVAMASVIALVATLAACAPTTPAPTVAAPVAAATPGALPPPPSAARRPVTDTHHGQAITDDYRWLENLKSPDTQAWMKAQAGYADGVLGRIAGRDQMLARLEALDRQVGLVVADVTRRPGDLWFYEKRSAGDNQYKLYLRRGLNGAEKLLVDPEQWQRRTGQPHALSHYNPSPSGRYVAYAVSAAGSEASTLHVLDTRDGKERIAPVDRVDYGGIYWQDDRHFFVNRLQEMKPGMPETAKYQKSAVYVVGIDRGLFPEPVFGPETRGVSLAPDHFAWVQPSGDGKHLIARVFNGVQREIAIWLAPAARSGGRAPGWRRVVDFRDEVTLAVPYGGGLFLLSQKDAPRGKLLRLDLARPDIAKAAVWLPQNDRVLTGLGAASDGLYLEQRQGNVKRLLRRTWTGSRFYQELPLPVEGDFTLQGFESPDLAYDPALPGVVIALQGWVSPKQVYVVDRARGVRNTGLQPRPDLPGLDALATTEVEVPSHDGAKVPLSLVHRRDAKLDGSNPVLLDAYASYGLTIDPRFNTLALAWLEAGGVLAYGNPRGSGARGEDWYQAGKGASKPNTWKDFIACGEWLVKQGWTSPRRLAISGGSAGGITVGRALTERPELFAVALPAVGALDMINGEDTANGMTNIPEFGSITQPDEFRALLAMSSYHQVKDGTAYPAVLLTHGVNDPRVDVWNSTKMAARLQAATSSGKPVLLRLDYEGGHGIGATKRQQLAERADTYAFALWQMGVPGYELRR